MLTLCLLALGVILTLQYIDWNRTGKISATFFTFVCVVAYSIYKTYDERKEAESIKQIKNESRIEEMRQKLEGLKRNGIGLVADRSLSRNSRPVGVSKYGGQPDVPDGFEWPRDNLGRPLSLLLQIDCAMLAAYDTEHLFPTTGRLYFFYELAEMEWDNEEQTAQVFYSDAPTATLHPADYPEDLEADCRITEHILRLSAYDSIPGGDDLLYMGYIKNFEETDVYSDAETRMHLTPLSPVGEAGEGTGEVVGTMSGYAATIQNSMLSDTPENDVLLLQLFSIYDEEDFTPLMFGDCGTIYFYITREELARRDFSHIRFEMQCY